MIRTRSPLRWVHWVFAAALLLKAALPLLASASAQLQSKGVAEVCTIYGVSLQPAAAGDADPDPAHDPLPGHGGTHCALTFLGAFAADDPQRLAPLPVPSDAAAPPPARRAPRAPDPSAAWVARLQHGPPARS